MQIHCAALLLAAHCLQLVLSGGGGRRAVWEQLSSIPTGRIPAGSVSCNGSIFIFGGETDATPGALVPNRYLNDLWVLPLNTMIWTQLSSGAAHDAPAARVSAGLVCASGGRLVLYGGIKRTSPTDNVVLGDVWSYDLDSNVWMDQHAPGPVLAGHTAVSTDNGPDVMIVFGGSTSNGKLSNQTWRLDTNSFQWSQVIPVGVSPAARDFHTAAGVPLTAEFVMWGGIKDTAVWRYDLHTSLWSAVPGGLGYESGRAGTVLKNKQMISFGGLSIQGQGVEYLNQVQYRGNESWANATSLTRNVPAGRCYAGLVSVGNWAYMIGGYSRDESSTTGKRMQDVWRLTLGH